MEILYFDSLPSTQTFLVEKIFKKELEAPIAVLAKEQPNGIGSRDNTWTGEKENFFVSIALDIESLPSDLSLASASVYFSFIMKKTLQSLGEEIWLKWPNDFYVKESKIGGTITKKVGNAVVFGMGINLKKSQNGYSALDSDISPEDLLDKYLESLLEFPKWKQIFSEFEVEFELSRRFSVHIESDKNSPNRGIRTSLEEAQLCEDGSLILGGRRVYSLR